ncbi:unnamed protein product, partial [Rotaria sordida]
RKYLKRVNTRKLFHGIGTLAPAICLLLISFLGFNEIPKQLEK